MLYIASDHAGYQLKEEIKQYLQSLSYSFEDIGPRELNPNDDYPDFAFTVARKVADEGGEGILFCGTGQGVCLAANKIKGIRAVPAYDEFMARQAKEHLDSNILCLGGRVLDAETAKKVVRVWLDTGFSGEERHKRRLGKIEEAESSHNI